MDNINFYMTGESKRHYSNGVEDIAEMLVDLCGVEYLNPGRSELIQKVSDGLHWLECATENQYNPDYFKAVWAVLNALYDKFPVEIPF